MLPIIQNDYVSLADIIPSCLSYIESTENKPLIDYGIPYGKPIILFILDGLGTHNFNARSAYARNIRQGILSSISSVTPTTTSSALISLSTAKNPNEHGIIGYNLWDKMRGKTVVTLNDWDYDKNREWVKEKSFFDNFDIKAAVLGKSRHKNTGLSKLIWSNVDYYDEDSMVNRINYSVSLLNKGYMLVIIYIDELDKIAHKEGWQSHSWATVLESIDYETNNIRKKIKNKASIIFCADHGMVDVEAKDKLFWNAERYRKDNIIMAGEPRFRHIYIKNEIYDVTKISFDLKELTYNNARIFSKEEAISEFNWHKVSGFDNERIGDIVCDFNGNGALYLGNDKSPSTRMIGQHGGSSAFEVDTFSASFY